MKVLVPYDGGDLAVAAPTMPRSTPAMSVDLL
jgi:hypothetical protein